MAELQGCSTQLDSIGNSTCITKPILSMIRGFIPEKLSHTYASITAFKTEDTVKAAIVARDILPLKLFEEIENVSTEELTSETSAGTKLFHRNGKYGFIGSMLLSPDQNRILQSWDMKVEKGYLIDDEGNQIGTTPDGTAVSGFTVNYFKVKPMDLPLAADGSAWSKIEVQLEYVEEVNESPIYAIATELDWATKPKKLLTEGLTKITLVPSTVAAFAFTCSFNYVDPTTGKSEPLRSLDGNGAELTVIDQLGATATVTVVETATAGTYTITDTGAAMTSGTITLNPSVDSMYYSDTTTVSAP